MNNCYLWMREQQEETNVEEQDRSLHVVEVCLPTVRQSFQLFDQQQMLDDEELPELSSSETDSNSKNNDPPSSERSSSSRQNAHQGDVRNAPEIPASVASSSQSLMRTSHRKKFLSRSHNSLVFRPPDYSKVESKVRKYIDSMREQQQQRRQDQQPQNELDPAPSVPALELTPSSCLMAPEDVTHLKRQLVDQEALVEVLQEDHDRLLLHNARLQNMLEEMRTKIRILHAQQQHQRPPQPKERRTNSPPQPEVDKDLSSSQESFLSSTKGGVGPLAAIQLGLTHHQDGSLSITPSSYLDLPPFGHQLNRKTEDDETSSCDSSWNSNKLLQLHQQNEATTAKAPAPVGLDKENIIKPALPEESLLPENHGNPDVLLLTQLKEITIAALEVRDQSRTIIRQINLIQPPGL